MKIWGEIPKIFGVSNKLKTVNKIERPAGINQGKDIVSISDQARDFQIAQKALKNIPDIRKEKVDLLSEKYEAGKYAVSGKDVADSIIKSILDKKV